jgi:hypothetical protein
MLAAVLECFVLDTIFRATHKMIVTRYDVAGGMVDVVFIELDAI